MSGVKELKGTGELGSGLDGSTMNVLCNVHFF